ncbi:MAG: hypothetical protein SFT94_04160 [Pseudanabaenaceae cyanobacterium bins.68]|nr:hypothetical protein [Pseudanabaenaceae cyanobacterium bins.68]
MEPIIEEVSARLDAGRALEISKAELPGIQLGDISIRQEKTRGRLAWGLMIGNGATLIVIFCFAAAQIYRGETSAAKELLALAWTSQITLLSSALGFYFGSKGN